MQVKVICILSLVSFIIIIGYAPLAAQSTSKDQVIKYYEGCVTKKIINCKAKIVLQTSRSVNLRQKADLSKRQVIFFMSHKNMLINEMVEQGIGQKQYKVDHYLNKRFFELNN